MGRLLLVILSIRPFLDTVPLTCSNHIFNVVTNLGLRSISSRAARRSIICPQGYEFINSDTKNATGFGWITTSVDLSHYLMMSAVHLLILFILHTAYYFRCFSSFPHNPSHPSHGMLLIALVALFILLMRSMRSFSIIPDPSHEKNEKISYKLIICNNYLLYLAWKVL